MSRRTNYHYDDRHDHSDEEDEKIVQLRDKVGLLKTVSIQIGEETREQNKFLLSQDSLADSILSKLSINTDHVKKLARAGHWRLYFYLIGFVFFVIFVTFVITQVLR